MLLQLFTFAIVMSPANPTWIDTTRDEISVTLGSVAQTKSGDLAVVGPKERAQRKTGTHQDARLEFRYLGPSKKTSKLASGGFVRQIGLKMRTKDTCNLLYVMWRIEPNEEIVITVKSNPGKSTHGDCGAEGYRTIARIPLRDIGVTATNHEPQRLRANIIENRGTFTCTVDVGEKTIWIGSIETDLIAPINGPVGFRSRRPHDGVATAHALQP